jgi:hypothetical protein
VLGDDWSLGQTAAAALSRGSGGSVVHERGGWSWRRRPSMFVLVEWLDYMILLAWWLEQE